MTEEELDDLPRALRMASSAIQDFRSRVENLEMVLRLIVAEATVGGENFDHAKHLEAIRLRAAAAVNGH